MPVLDAGRNLNDISGMKLSGRAGPIPDTSLVPPYIAGFARRRFRLMNMPIIPATRLEGHVAIEIPCYKAFR